MSATVSGLGQFFAVQAVVLVGAPVAALTHWGCRQWRVTRAAGAAVSP